MDSERAKQIMSSSQKIDVLYQGAPVWIENIKDSNIAEVTLLDSHTRETVPVYKLVEVNPVNTH